MPKKEPEITFEAAIERLESHLFYGDGEVPLAQMVSKFEEGSKLLKECQTQLKEAELTIEKLDPDTNMLDALDAEIAIRLLNFFIQSNVTPSADTVATRR